MELKFKDLLTTTLITLLLPLSLAFADWDDSDEYDDFDEPSSSSESRPLSAQAQFNTNTFRFCYNWGCEIQAQIKFSKEDMDLINSIFSDCPAKNSTEELQQIRTAIRVIERIAAEQVSALKSDRGGNNYDKGINGATDCVDNASNTNNGLYFLKSLGRLKYWSIGETHIRGSIFSKIPFLAAFTLNPHWTATVIEKSNPNNKWAVDSWMLPNGQKPYIQSLYSWLDGVLPWKVKRLTDLNEKSGPACLDDTDSFNYNEEEDLAEED